MDTIRLAIAGIIHDHKDHLLAKKMDLNKSTLHKWAEPSTENSPHGEISIRRAVQLTLVAEDTRLMSAIAAEAGGVFVPGHQLVGGRFKSERAALQVMHDAAELIENYTTAMEDGRVSACEYKELAREAMQLHMAAAAIVEIAREKAGI